MDDKDFDELLVEIEDGDLFEDWEEVSEEELQARDAQSAEKGGEMLPLKEALSSQGFSFEITADEKGREVLWFPDKEKNRARVTYSDRFSGRGYLDLNVLEINEYETVICSGRVTRTFLSAGEVLLHLRPYGITVPGYEE